MPNFAPPSFDNVKGQLFIIGPLQILFPGTYMMRELPTDFHTFLQAVQSIAIILASQKNCLGLNII